jgi:hypothetical protein
LKKQKKATKKSSTIIKIVTIFRKPEKTSGDCGETQLIKN